MISKRLLETLAMLIIGDSVLALISPSRHVSLWLSGPSWWERTWSPMVRRPALTRILGLVGLSLGVWLAWREQPPAPMLGRTTGTLAPNGRIRHWAARLAEAMQ